MGGNISRRHHYIPQMMLRNFTDPDGSLWFWRRDFPQEKILQATTDKLFVQKDLYSQVNFDGERDVALESFFAEQEALGADFIRQLSAIVRSGKAPKLDENAWDFWHHFFYYQMKRAPAHLDEMAKRVGFRQQIEHAAELVRREEVEAGLGRDNSGLADRMYDNALVVARGMAPSTDVLELFENQGIAIYRVVDPAKSFIVGDAPGAMARVNSYQDTPLDGKAIFLPLTHDLALGYLAKRREIVVINVGGEQVRRMNYATAKRSSIIAGRSSSLTRSLAQTVPYQGIPGGEASPPA